MKAKDKKPKAAKPTNQKVVQLIKDQIKNENQERFRKLVERERFLRKLSF